MIPESEAQEKRIKALEAAHRILLDQLHINPAQENPQVNAAAAEIKQQLGPGHKRSSYQTGQGQRGEEGNERVQNHCRASQTGQRGKNKTK